MRWMVRNIKCCFLSLSLSAWKCWVCTHTHVRLCTIVDSQANRKGPTKDLQFHSYQHKINPTAHSISFPLPMNETLFRHSYLLTNKHLSPHHLIVRLRNLLAVIDVYYVIEWSYGRRERETCELLSILFGAGNGVAKGGRSFKTVWLNDIVCYNDDDSHAVNGFGCGRELSMGRRSPAQVPAEVPSASFRE